MEYIVIPGIQAYCLLVFSRGHRGEEEQGRATDIVQEIMIKAMTRTGISQLQHFVSCFCKEYFIGNIAAIFIPLSTPKGCCHTTVAKLSS